MSGSICADYNMYRHRTLVTRTTVGGVWRVASVLRAPVALVEDLGSGSSIHMVAPKTSLTPVLGVPAPSSDLYGYQKPTWYTCKQTRRQNPHIGKIINEYFFKKSMYGPMNKIIFITPKK